MRDIHLIVGAMLIGWLLMQFARLGLGEILILYAVVFAAVVKWRRSHVTGQKKRRRIPISRSAI